MRDKIKKKSKEEEYYISTSHVARVRSVFLSIFLIK